jgi:hypothetical protein
MLVKFLFLCAALSIDRKVQATRFPVLRIRGGMRCVVQRVKSASVVVEGETVARFDKRIAFLVLL